MGKIATGIDPIAEKVETRTKGVTLSQVLEDYLLTRKNLKASTAKEYRQMLVLYFADWKDKPMLSITKDDVAKKHTILGEKNGHARANLAMRLLRALFNFATGQYENSQGSPLILENPVIRLSQTQAWYRIKPRKTFIKRHELACWYQGIMALESTVTRDYLLLIMFTGLRRNEAARLKWEQVDLNEKTITFPETKNHEEHKLPLSHYIYELLVERKALAETDYVFPGAGKDGCLAEPKKAVFRVTQLSGVKFTVHDLRRTFITIAESLDLSAYALKRLLNHKMNNDITADYIVTDVERLRRPMQQITDYLLEKMMESAQSLSI